MKQAETLTENETAEACDLDKMWDALHFVLTGDTLSDAADHDPLSEAVCGSDFLAPAVVCGRVFRQSGKKLHRHCIRGGFCRTSHTL